MFRNFCIRGWFLVVIIAEISDFGGQENISRKSAQSFAEKQHRRGHVHTFQQEK
jgi:hypothetical protein